MPGQKPPPPPPTTTAQSKELILFRYCYSTIRSRCILHCHFKNSSFLGKIFSPLAIGFCLHKERHGAILFLLLFEHFQSSPGSLPHQLNHHLMSNCITIPICKCIHPQEAVGLREVQLDHGLQHLANPSL